MLGLNLHDYQIYEGNRHSLTELELPQTFQKNINEALGYDLTDKHTTTVMWWCEESNQRHASRPRWKIR
jgi:hypothetical protein